MNIKEYRDKKARGLAEVVKAGGGFALAVKIFSSDDGSELMPEITAIDPDELDSGYSSGFYIAEYKIDEDNWLEGFVSV